MREYAESAASSEMKVIARVALRQNIEQPRLAKERGVAESTIQRNFESKQPTQRVILEFCDVLGIKGPGARALANTLEAADYAEAARDLKRDLALALDVTDESFALFERVGEDKRRRELRDFIIDSKVLKDVSQLEAIAKRHGMLPTPARRRAMTNAFMLWTAIKEYGVPSKEAVKLGRDLVRRLAKRGYIQDIKAALKGFDDDYLTKVHEGGS